jgi:hypothetical protein
VLSPELVLDDETLKYLLLFGCAAGLWVFARWASRLGGSDPSLSYPQVPQLDAPVPARPATDPKSALSFLPPDLRLGSIRIRSFYFSKFNAVPGPTDQDRFMWWGRVFDPSCAGQRPAPTQSDDGAVAQEKSRPYGRDSLRVESQY